MNGFANSFLLLFYLDGLLSFVDDILPGIPSLSLLRKGVGGASLLGAMALYVLMAATPRLPKRIFCPPVAYLLFFSLIGGLPLPLYVEWQTSKIIISCLQLFIGLLTLCQIRTLTPERRWFVPADALQGPAFRWTHTLRFVGINIALILPGMILYFIACLSLGISHLTAGFLYLRPQGLESEAREYVRGSKTVCLIPLVHIGQNHFYSEIGQAYTNRKTVVIMEGISDAKGCLQSIPKIQQGLAATGGLALQPKKLFPHLTLVRHADVDAGTFSPLTLRLINALAPVFTARSPQETADAWEAFARQKIEFDRTLFATLKHDLLDERNRHCINVIENALTTSDCLLVPWGALHMPSFEQYLLEQGFEKSRATHRRVFQFIKPRLSLASPSR